MSRFISIENAAVFRKSILARNLAASGRRTGLVIGVGIFALLVLGSSAAQAQNCSSDSATGSLKASVQAGPIGVPVVIGPVGVGPLGLGPLASSAISTAVNLGAALSTANTAFLTQGTAFVGDSSSPVPDQAGGGVWTRGVGGAVDIKSASTTNLTGSLSLSLSLSTPKPLPPINLSGSASVAADVGCTSKVHENFAGIQVGQDIARLNVDGWNLNVGTTAGEIGTKGSETGGVGAVGGATFTNNVKAPFFGTYAAVSKGGFMASAIIRGDFFEADPNSPALNINNQNLDARGITIGGSVGYHYDVPQSSWFVEPSAGLIYSRVHVDAFNWGGIPGPTIPALTIPKLGFTIPGSASTLQGTLALDDITSTTGRLGVTFGESFASGNVIWQPFAAVSVWSDFGATISGNFGSCGNPSSSQNCAFGPLPLGTIQGQGNFTTQGLGTYGQYSLGVASRIVNTGWLGFARVDFRDGERLEGWDATGGIRYQFTPELLVASRKPIREATRTAVPYNWTGVYVGGVLGGVAGSSREDFGDVYNHSFFVPGGGVGDAGPRVAGLLGGADVGYNYQIGKWVLGVEADITDTNTSGSVACTDLSTPGTDKTTSSFPPLHISVVGFPAHPLWNTTCSAQASWIGTITGRLGLALWDRNLFYVKGGAAFTQETFTATCNIPGTINGGVSAESCYNPAGNLLSSLSAATNPVGATVGLGTEFALTKNWSAKAEWDYINFGSRSLVASDGTVMNSGVSLNEVKIGANYRFGP